MVRSKENLTWIMDGKNRTQEDTCKENIKFVHSLGFKCDSVGWCELDLDKQNMDGMLQKIYSFAKQNGFLLRGSYSKSVFDFDSEWYALKFKYLTNDALRDTKILDTEGNELYISESYAYKVPKHMTIIDGDMFGLITEHFRNTCIKHGFEGIDFYWVRDIGKYDSAQYFGLLVEAQVKEYACDQGLDYSYRIKKGRYPSNGNYAGEMLYRKYQEIGGFLPELSNMFYNLKIELPLYLSEKNMPDKDFAFIYGSGMSQYVLLRQRVIKALLDEKVLKAGDVTPVQLYQSPPPGYSIQKSQIPQYPSTETVDKLLDDFNKLKENPKPKYNILEKDALKLLRYMKKQRKEEFNKGMPMKQREQLKSSICNSLLPYYAICNGGYLSDEYCFLPYCESQLESKDFAYMIKTEELLKDRPTGIVIAKCADGDYVIITEEIVHRVSHEVMDIIETWKTIAQFFYESLEE
jgi:hypothetical protein